MSNLTKIFIDTPMFAVGGVESFSINLALGLQTNKSLEVFLIESKASKAFRLSDHIIEKINLKVPIISLSTYTHEIQKSKSKTITITSWNKELIKTLYHLFSENKISKKTNRIVGYVHNEASHYYDTMRLYEPIFDKIICVSKGSYSFLKEQLPEIEKKALFRPCPTSINIDSFSEKKYSSKNQPIVLTFIGRLEDKSKGVFRIPEILHLLKEKGVDFFIKIIGDGPDKNLLENKLSNFNGKYEITFANGQDELKKLIQNVDLILLTSNFEGGPLVVYEAMGCGVVPIVTPVGNMPNLIKSQENGFIVPIGDNNKFAEIVELFYNNKDLLSSVGKKSYDTIKTLGYFQKDYDKFFVTTINDIWKQKYSNANEIKSIVEKNKQNKELNTFDWIQKTIPKEVISRYWLDHYFELTNQKPNSSEINDKLTEVINHYNKVYEKMPLWWKKIGSLIRKIKND